ncbi:tRNA lysidine(34) synthetase TilS [Alkalibacillus aidingensis]|uniref:tRNA lysidine(34) synthetase TilS n=1 Tax=Alkalibacillus aidingensis TaxID=2747607 RepID=UPI00166034B5|nr:tRNA lysidine(34) synthetase TilS [Alkalibacillus aidingensis]
MQEKILHFNQQQQLFNQGDHLFLAVSGGADSMAMLHFFAWLKEEWDLTLTTLTVDHQLRGEESHQDVQFVKEQSEQLGVPCLIKQVNVTAYKNANQVGTQEAARELRYQFFKEQLINNSKAKLVLAHHADDQLETMYMQLTKGVKPTGIFAKRELGEMTVIRPLLTLTKEELLDYIKESEIEYREDPSNQEVVYTRNRFRKELLPFLKKENPNLHQGVNRVHDQMVDEDRFLNELTEERMSQFSQFSGNKVSFSIKCFNEMARPLQRRGFHLILNYLSVNMSKIKDYFPSFLEWITSNKPNSLFSPTEEWLALKAYDRCYITTDDVANQPFSMELNLGEKVKLPNDWVISLVQANDDHLDNQQVHTFICDQRLLHLPLTVRSKKPGDRMKLKGLNGRKKVKDIFIDEKIPKFQRDQWPLVENGNGELIWIPFIRKSDLAEKSDSSNYKIIIDIGQN